MKWIGRALLLALGLGVGLAVAEAFLAQRSPRLTYHTFDRMSPRMYQASDISVFGLQPGARTQIDRDEFSDPIAINAQGLRMDGDVPREKPAGRSRILVIGDSFAFGWGVAASEAFPSQLERRLQSRGLPVDVVNMGFAMGTAPDAYYAGLRHDARFEADVLVVSVFVDNDIVQTGIDEWPELDARRLPARVANPLLRVDAEHRLRMAETRWRYRVPGLRNSHVVIALAELAESLGWVAGEEADPRFASQGLIYAEAWTPWLEESFNRMLRALVGIRDLARERDQQLLVAVIPDRRQVFQERWQPIPGQPPRLMRELRTRPRAEVPQARLEAALSAQGVAVLDLLPRLVGASDRSLYFMTDPHFAPSGHVITAVALEAELSRRGWLPSP